MPRALAFLNEAERVKQNSKVWDQKPKQLNTLRSDGKVLSIDYTCFKLDSFLDKIKYNNKIPF